MDKQLYAKCLSERLMEMSMANEAAQVVFVKELKPQTNYPTSKGGVGLIPTS